MTRLVIDARLAGHSGIGTYLDHVLPRVVSLLAPWRPLVLARTASRLNLSSLLAPYAEVATWDVPPLGVRNLLSAPPGAGPRDLLWTPHFNVPVRGSSPLAVTLHDLLPVTAPRLAGRGRSFPVRLWLHVIRARARVIFSVSEFTRREAVLRGGLDDARLVVTPLGVDRRWFDAGSTARPVTEPGDSSVPTIIFVGLPKPHKNLTRLLQAFASISSQIPHRMMLVTATRGIRNVDLGVMPMVRAMGERVALVEQVPLPELIERVRSAQFAALPSLHEGFGLPALEAMAAGTPLLVSGAGGLPEVCGDAALYCDPLSVEDIARGLLRLATDPELRARLSDAGSRRAASFSWERCASRTAEALESELVGLSGSTRQ